MARKSLVNEVVDGVFEDIVSGAIPIGSGMPSEAELGERYDVSRVTVREAIKTLQAQGVLHVASGKGSSVNPLTKWTSLAAVLRIAVSRTDDADVAEQLIEVRRMFETGATALAARRRSDDDLHELAERLVEMKTAHETNDVASFVAADLAFHNIILAASHNIFLTVMFEPLTRILMERRAETSRVPEIQAHAIVEHENVLRALETGDPDLSLAAMQSHMDQTLADLRSYVLHTAP